MTVPVGMPDGDQSPAVFQSAVPEPDTNVLVVADAPDTEATIAVVARSSTRPLTITIMALGGQGGGAFERSDAGIVFVRADRVKSNNPGRVLADRTAGRFSAGVCSPMNDRSDEGFKAHVATIN